MILSEIRSTLIEMSGRHDFVASPSMANLYINAGQKWLDRHYNVNKAMGRFFKKPASGGYVLTFQNCRAIKEVWTTDANDGKFQLEKKDMSWLRSEYPDPINDLDTGGPLYYAPANLRIVPEADRLPVDDLDGVVDFMDVMFDEHYVYNGIVYMPPTDGSYMIEVWGLFYSPELSADGEKSFWSEMHPIVLIMAALRQIEVIHRNSEGVKDWEAAIGSELTSIDMDAIEEEIADIDQMEG